MPGNKYALLRQTQNKKPKKKSKKTAYGATSTSPMTLSQPEYNNGSLTLSVPSSHTLSLSVITLFRTAFIKAFEKSMRSYIEKALYGSPPEGWQKLSVDLGCGALTAGAIAAQAYGDEANVVNSFLLFSVVGTIVEYIIKPSMHHGYSLWNQRKANEVTEASYFLRKNACFKSGFLNKFVDEFCIKFQDKFRNLPSGGGIDVVMERLSKEAVDGLFNAILKYFQGNTPVLEQAIIQDRDVEPLIVNLLENISDDGAFN